MQFCKLSIHSYARRLGVVHTFLVAAGLCGSFQCAASETPAGSYSPSAISPSHSLAPAVAAQYAKLPLSFEPNRGQAGPESRFLTHGSAYTLYLGPKSADLVLERKDHNNQSVRLRMELAGANPKTEIAGAEQLPGKVNYLIGNDPAKWHTDIPTFSRVQYSAIYSGIDLVFYGNDQRIEYDFVVKPGANPQAIRLQYPGAAPLRIAKNGDLLLTTGGREVRQLAPVIYQEKAGDRRSIRGKYVLLSKREVGFQIADYDHQRPLIIDPALVFSTLLGGSSANAADSVNALAVDSAGNVYVAGSTSSTDFPATAGAFQAADPGGAGQHAFVAKLNPTGTALIYATYLGGTTPTAVFGTNELATSLAIDASGNAIVAGKTNNSDFPTTPSGLQPTSSGCGPSPATIAQFCKGFVTKLNSTGSALLYSTYLGGSGPDGIFGLTGDSNGMIYVTGTTFSSDFPTTPGALKTVFNPGGPRFFQSNGFVTKIDPSQAGTASLVYSTYLGGAQAQGNAITVDSAGNAYITGPAFGDFPVTPGALHATGGAAFFVAKLNPAGSALVYGAMVGGTTLDTTSANAIAVDAAGSIYLTGFTTDPTFPVTAGAFQTAIPLGGPAFVTKLNPTGSALVYSTFLGGNTTTGASESGVGNSIAIDSAGNAFVAGVTAANDFPVTPITLDPVCSANASCLFSTISNFPTVDNAFVTELNPSGSALVFSTYLGGSTADRGNAIALDGGGNIYVGGATQSCDFPATPGAFQTSTTRCQQGFVAKISATAAGSAAAFLPGTVKFPPEAIGTAAPTQTAVLTNRGNADLAISNIAFNNGGVFTESNNCGATLIPAASCTFTFGFTPNATTTFAGQVSVTDNAVGSPHIVNLTGAGGTPAATLSGTSLTFASQVLNSTSASQSITLTNGGTADLQVTNVTTTGDFAQTNTCGSFVTAGTKCDVSVTFKPTALGSRSGSLTITDNAASSPQTILLGGTGADFTLAATSSSASVTAGQAANFSLSITPAGTFTQPITLACSGAPAGATCTVNPASITPAGSASITATVTVTTTAHGLGIPTMWMPRSAPPMLLVMSALLMMLLGVVATHYRRHLRPRIILAGAAIALLLAIVGCGGGSSGGGGGGGTPPGAYSLTVTATSGTASKTMPLSLTVN